MSIFLPAIPLAAGFILDALIGDPHWLPHPIRLIGALISALEKFVRKHFNDLFWGGIFLAVFTLIVSTLIPIGFLIAAYSFDFWLGIAIESVMCFYLTAAKSLQNESMKVYRELKKGDVEGARKAVSMIVGRDTEPLDEDGITRAAVETVAENSSDGVCAPIIFIALFGAAGGFFYKAANTMDSMIGYKNERYFYLGKAAAKIDDALNFLPSRITALTMIFASFILKMDHKNARKIWLRDRRNHASPNSAQTESVTAGALGLRIAGNAYYFGKLHEKPFIGDELRHIEAEDIPRADRLMYTTSLLVLIIFLCIRILIFGVIF